MTRADYEILAAAIRHGYSTIPNSNAKTPEQGANAIVNTIIEILGTNYTNFNKTQFIQAIKNSTSYEKEAEQIVNDERVKALVLLAQSDS